MNIREAILEEHSKANATRIATYACSSSKRFKELMDCYLDPEYRIAQRAAWSVSWAARTKPNLVQPYIAVLVAALQRKDAHPAVIRNAVRVLEELDIPETYHADVLNACFGFIENIQTPAAIKAFSLTTLFNLSKVYPDILQELKLIIEERWDAETPAFRARGKKILKAIT